MGGIVGITLAGSAGVVPQADVIAAAASVTVEDTTDDEEDRPRPTRRDPSDEIARDPTRSWSSGDRARPTAGDVDATDAEPTAAEDDADTTTDDAAQEQAPAEGPADAWHDDPLAVFQGVEIIRPAEDVRLVGFHEAASAGAVPLTSRQPLEEAHGREAVPADPSQDDARDVTTLVLPTRGRAQPSSSAVDIAVDADETVAAPVSGTVLTVDPYLLYGEVPDTRIVIRPHDRPDLRVVILHVSDASVVPGDVVEAGETQLAGRPTPLPFESQVDRFTAARTGTATPHVHVEVRTD